MQASNLLASSKTLAIYGAPLIAVFAITVVMNTTNPLTVGPLGILLLMSLIYVTIVLVLNAALTAAIVVADKFTTVSVQFKKRLRYMTTILGLGPVLLIALNSIGQASLIDTLLVLVFTTLGCFYIARRVGRSAI